MSKYSKLLKRIKDLSEEKSVPGLTVQWPDENGELVGINVGGNQPLPANVKRVLPVKEDFDFYT